MSKSLIRTRNMLANSAVGILATLLQTVLNYAVRIVLVRELGAEINGLHNLFQSLLSVMSLMEAGFGTAMVVHLYKPVENEDQEQIRSIMAFYRRIYGTISLAFLGIGVLVNIFFIDKIVTSTIPLSMVRFYFLIFILSFVGNYATYYKRSILFAEQKNRISTWATLISEIIFRSAQMVSAFIWHNYVIFLVLMILEKVCSNLACNFYIDRHHPYLRNLHGVRADQKLKHSVYKMVKPLLVFNVSSTVQQSSKSILISSLLGNVSIVGYFGNYSLVTSAFTLLFSQFGAAYTSAIGNLAVNGDANSLYNYYKKVTWLMDWAAITAAAGILSCVQDFILFTFGESFLLPVRCVVILLVDLLYYLFSIPIISIQNAMGLHYKDKNYMAFQAACVVVLGYLGGKFFGMEGLLIGTTIPPIILTLIHKGLVLYPIVFERSGKNYILFLTEIIAKTVSVMLICYCTSILIHMDLPFFNFLLKGATTGMVCGLLFILEAWRCGELLPFIHKLKNK